MKRFLLYILLLSSAFAAFAQKDVIPPAPNPPRLVNDFARLLAPDQAEALERKLVAYDDSTSNQIAIVTTNSIGDYDISDYALELGRKWGVGNKEFNNGIVVVVLKDDVNKKRKVWIATGYGLEGAIPDITAKRIIETEIIPAFKANDIYRGLNNGTDALIKAAAGEYKPPEGYHKRKKGMSFESMMVLVFLGFIILVIISRMGGGKNGGMMSRRGYRNWTGPTWWIGSGGSGGGGGWTGGGGGGGGGGFGGFGGGSFGGGGAGGDW
jgi:uncharacterized protein